MFASEYFYQKWVLRVTSALELLTRVQRWVEWAPELLLDRREGAKEVLQHQVVRHDQDVDIAAGVLAVLGDRPEDGGKGDARRERLQGFSYLRGDARGLVDNAAQLGEQRGLGIGLHRRSSLVTLFVDQACSDEALHLPLHGAAAATRQSNELALAKGPLRLSKQQREHALLCRGEQGRSQATRGIPGPK